MLCSLLEWESARVQLPLRDAELDNSIVTKNSWAMSHGAGRGGAGRKVWRLESDHCEDSSTPWAAGATEDSLLGELTQ